MNISIVFDFDNQIKILKELIMATRQELSAQLSALAESVLAESSQVTGKIAELTTAVTASNDVVAQLNALVAELRARIEELSVDEDFSAEVAALAAIKQSIDAIYVPEVPAE